MKFHGWLPSVMLTVSASGAATTYPLKVTDMDNQQIIIRQEPQHIILQDGRDIMSLALLDRENPFKRLVAWNNLPKKQDPQTWAVLEKTWQQASKIIDMGFNDQGQVNLESVIAEKPDLMIAQLRAKPALQQTGVLTTLQKLSVPVVFIDYELHPAQNTANSITLMGQILNQEANAKAYTDFYHQHWNALQKKLPGLSRNQRYLSSLLRVTVRIAASLTVIMAGVGWWKRWEAKISVPICYPALQDLSHWKRSSP